LSHCADEYSWVRQGWHTTGTKQNTPHAGSSIFYCEKFGPVPTYEGGKTKKAWRGYSAKLAWASR